MLERRYDDSQGWLLFYEVANRTGFSGGFADALALSIWPSRGIQLIGFEVKRSRGDLLKELRDESKAATFMRYCSAWWLVVSDAKLVDGVEIPANWGILAPRNDVLYQLRAAPKLEPEPWNPGFIAALMRRFHEKHVKKGTQVAAEHTARQQPTDVQLRREYELLRQTVTNFEAASGLSIRDVDASEVGKLVRDILDARGRDSLKTNLQNGLQSAERIARAMRGALVNLERMETEE